MKTLKYGNIRDLPYDWVNETRWHRVAYDMWKDMWRRVYTHKNYFGCLIQEDYKYLSNFIRDLQLLDNFDNFKQNPRGWSIDKDIKIKGNRDYYFNSISLVTRKDNSKDVGERNLEKYGSLSNLKRIPVMGFNDNKVLLFRYIRESSFYGFDPSTICKCLKYSRKFYKGYKWVRINYNHNKQFRYIRK